MSRMVIQRVSCEVRKLPGGGYAVCSREVGCPWVPRSDAFSSEAEATEAMIENLRQTAEYERSIGAVVLPVRS